MTEQVPVEAICGALKAATPGPWQIDGPFYWQGGLDPVTAPIITATKARMEVAVMPDYANCANFKDRDAELIVLLRNNAEVLLKEIERLQAVVTEQSLELAHVNWLHEIALSKTELVSGEKNG